jgi:NADH:ubiquinone oxidoreductase subunit E
LTGEIRPMGSSDAPVVNCPSRGVASPSTCLLDAQRSDSFFLEVETLRMKQAIAEKPSKQVTNLTSFYYTFSNVPSHLQKYYLLPH